MTAPLPEVLTSIVDEAYVESLFAEVEAHCTGLGVRVRERGDSASAEAPVTLDEARRALKRGGSVQLRYEHDGVVWSDTLSATPEGVRLIRCQLPEA